MAKLTPMMAQYKRIKAEYEGTILMFRLGDFYEMFFDDAIEASKILQITLTARSKGENATPMCGVPYHAVDGYLAKLTKAGRKVALCDQVSEPTGKGIVEREVIRVVTPGTTFDESILDQKANNFVAALVAGDKGRYGFGYADVTTGDFWVTELEGGKACEEELVKVGPAECIGMEEVLRQDFVKNQKEICKFPFGYGGDAESDLKGHFGVQSLTGFGLEGLKLATQVAGMLLAYLKETQKTELQHIQKISYYHVSEFMPLDQSCVRNLELFYTNQGKKDGSLVSVIDRTVNAMGGRLLRNWLMKPLVDRKKIEARHGQVEQLVEDSTLLRSVRGALGNIYDVERLLSRLSIGTGNARDLLAMKQSLAMVPELVSLLGERLEEVVAELENFDELVALIERAICDEPPVSLRDGGMMRDGYNSELDDLRKIRNEGKGFLAELQQREIEATGIANLKIKFNKVFGYYIEISKSYLNQVPEHYIRKQTLVNAERFFIPELKEYEEKVLGAEDRIKELEYKLFYDVRMEVVKEIVRIQKTAKAIAHLDVVAGLAELAVSHDYVRPEMNEVGEMEIVKGRHPVIEAIGGMKDFVPNDCRMDDGRTLLLITGPNMGGKSTYLRQVALISLMAQMGSYVPAARAILPVVDRIFTRVGASDNLSKGESTFMVEMQEAAYILHNATERSLVILDELGRGTSTYDGVSIAWAVMEFLHGRARAKTLFATHYHELIDLAEALDRAANLSVVVKENQEGVVFLYRIAEGGVDKSYGIEVARLAGLPGGVVTRAENVLGELEEKHIKQGALAQMGLFDEVRDHAGLSDGEKKALEELKDLNINNMTPIEAIKKLNELKCQL